jgi:hypothetical protein
MGATADVWLFPLYCESAFQSLAEDHKEINVLCSLLLLFLLFKFLFFSFSFLLFYFFPITFSLPSFGHLCRSVSLAEEDAKRRKNLFESSWDLKEQELTLTPD